jgi:hypothetical protein
MELLNFYTTKILILHIYLFFRHIYGLYIFYTVLYY